MHILIAPNAFKHSLSATEVAEAIQVGLKKSALEFKHECFPVGDGGDGTGELIIKKLSGSRVELNVQDPLGRTIRSSYGLIEKGKTAVIEMANASGLRLLDRYEMNPLKTSSLGTGSMMKDALDKGVKKIILAMGGSATVDGGCGILKALGLRFFDDETEQEVPSPENLMHLEKIDTSELDPRIHDCEIIILCDVDNPLLGSNGAASVFGPQKGATADDVYKLEKFLNRFAAVAMKQTKRNLMDMPRVGTAGGAAGGLFAFLQAKLVNGIDYYLELTNFESAINKADLVITGEGSIDNQTLSGKGPFGVASRAKKKGIGVIGLAGKVPIKKSRQMQQYFDVLLPIGNEPSDLNEALKSTKKNLERTAFEIGNLLSLKRAI
ncbi:MAG TPA: glycerate kinase [Flavisolibacter sp.]|nr:glycerate kinase [Flavisolibacter sp.]